MKFARHHGFQVRRTICEILENAPTDPFARKGILLLLSTAGHRVTWWKHQFQPMVILVHTRSDFEVSDLELTALLLHFQRQGVHVLEVSSEKELAGSIAPQSDTLVADTKSGLALVRQRLIAAAGRASKMRQGTKCGTKPFGHTTAEKAVLDEIRKLRRKPPNRRRRSFQRIADILNSRNLPSRSKRPWTRETIRGIVSRSWPQIAQEEAVPKYRSD